MTASNGHSRLVRPRHRRRWRIVPVYGRGRWRYHVTIGDGSVTCAEPGRPVLRGERLIRVLRARSYEEAFDLHKQLMGWCFDGK
jgi:hypothetical protein